MSTRLGRVEWGAGADRQRTSIANWRKPLLWDKEAAKTRKRTLVFCASLADVFDNEVDDCWRRDLFALIEQTPNLTWLLLTKRIGNVIRMTDGLSGGYWLPPNAALGATMANQAEYDRDSLKLREAGRVTGAMFTFGSFEPLLGPVVLGKYAPSWVIAGGESGPDARPMNPAWARSLRDQCAAASVPFLFKQWGVWAPTSVAAPHLKQGDATECFAWNGGDLLGADTVMKVGKKAAGRLLDGVEHNGFPT